MTDSARSARSFPRVQDGNAPQVGNPGFANRLMICHARSTFHKMMLRTPIIKDCNRRPDRLARVRRITS
jgi:hypothetical protein